MKANELQAAAAAEREKLLGKFQNLQNTVPGLIKGLAGKVAALEAMKKLPKGMDTTQVAAAKEQIDQMNRLCAEAMAAFSTGNAYAAVAAGENIMAQAEGLTRKLEAVP